jgi:ELWxxDGT repeat protein
MSTQQVELFVGQDGGGQFELWITDGTAPGTYELTGITGLSQAGGFNSPDLTAFNGEVLFQGTDTSGAIGLWVTDGTVAGTHEVTGIIGASSTGFLKGVNSTDFTVFNGEVLFEGINASGSQGLWITDGTAAATHEITGISGAFTGTYGGLTGFHPGNFTVYNNKVLFSASDTTFGGGADQLWITDGTAAGTHELIGISGASFNLFPEDMTLFNGKVLFAGQDSAFHMGLWITDGTVTGTHEITNAVEVVNPDFTLFNNMCCLRAEVLVENWTYGLRTALPREPKNYRISAAHSRKGYFTTHRRFSLFLTARCCSTASTRAVNKPYGLPMAPQRAHTS